ncbi:MAG: Glyoxalase [Candidatus Amesbacteria bacterium GW2011_GWA2_42_12]|uniref:Glyoxalase n=1 Tax=Candidatus Amesbacteria bacterium GW2011_GWA2_42_12 TaxID=1618356 RepID=A0A0G1AGR4_9BACT|nr:MAG: Glyoxalase [Candidatus Amesbacteria bacterium GW2011_GWA2_42_12]
MKASVYHIQINCSDIKVSTVFYKKFLGFLEYKIIHDGSLSLGMTNSSTDFWLVETDKKYKASKFHRKNTGLNHIAFMVSSKGDVEKFVKEFIKPQKISTLYNTPKLFPEYTSDYYAVFFEDPDRIKLEVCYHK